MIHLINKRFEVRNLMRDFVISDKTQFNKNTIKMLSLTVSLHYLDFYTKFDILFMKHLALKHLNKTLFLERKHQHIFNVTYF